jgi:hypothetical protein
MPMPADSFPILALLTAILGLTGVAWRHWGGAALGRFGWYLAFAMLGILGAATLFAAGQPHRGVLPLGLMLGLLVLATLWEQPEAQKT